MNWRLALLNVPRLAIRWTCVVIWLAPVHFQRWPTRWCLGPNWEIVFNNSFIWVHLSWSFISWFQKTAGCLRFVILLASSTLVEDLLRFVAHKRSIWSFKECHLAFAFGRYWGFRLWASWLALFSGRLYTSFCLVRQNLPYFYVGCIFIDKRRTKNSCFLLMWRVSFWSCRWYFFLASASFIFVEIFHQIFDRPRSAT